jgi:hypothetical protein
VTQRVIPPPYAHQLVAEQRLDAGAAVNPHVYALLMEMGTAKSRPLLRHWLTLAARDEVDDLLIIAPGGCYLNWTTDTKNPAAEPGELDKWLTDEERKRVWVHAWSAGPGKRAKEALESFISYRGLKRRVFLVNVESTSTVKLCREVVKQFLQSRRVMWAIDESTCIMHESARTTFIQDLRELAAFRYILTGLVAPENPLNVFQQFWFLDWRILGFRNYFAFQARYAITVKKDFRPAAEKERGARKVRLVMDYHHQTQKAWLVSLDPGAEPVWLAKEFASRGAAIGERFEFFVSDWLAEERGLVKAENSGRGTTVVVGYRNQEELAARIASASYRVLKADVLDLPPKSWEFRDVPLTDEQARMYDEMRRHATTELEGRHITAEMKMHQIKKMHEMLCGHTTDEERGVVDIPSHRVNELMTLLQDHSGKAVIWAPYPRLLEKITDALRTAYGERSTVTFWGATSRADRQDAKHRIQRADDTRFIVANQAVGGEGNTWTRASLTIYAANSQKNKDRQQSEDRVHRAGQTENCHYVDLRARGTVDERWVQAIRSKMDLGDALSGDKWREWLV